MKSVMRRVLTSAPVRYPTLLAMKLANLASRTASVLRTAAIFANGTLPTCHWSVTVKYPESITLGQGVVIGPKCTLGGKGGIVLGDHVRISEGVMIETAGLDFRSPPPYSHIAKPIHIEDGVWIGARAVILAGVRIGRGSIIGAGAVVSRDVPAESVVVGQPPSVRARATGRTYAAEQ